MLKVVFILLKPVQGSFPHAKMLNGKQEWSDGVMSERRPKHLGFLQLVAVTLVYRLAPPAKSWGRDFRGA